MNATAPTKPVMDVALPKRPVSAPRRTAQARVAAVPAAASLVRRKPLTPAPRTKAVKEALAKRLPQQQPAPAVQQPTPASAASRAERRVPVALITVTAFVILILSVLAVTLYVTSQVA